MNSPYDTDGYVTNAVPFDTLTASTIVNGTGNAATNPALSWDVPTDGRVVRYMNYGVSNTTTGDPLSVEANTLYNDRYRTTTGDRGLPLHPDCKIVVVQKQYGTFEKMPFTDIESALGYLNDYYAPNDGITHFRGTIAAVLDTSGRATMVVIDSAYELAPDQNDIPNISEIPADAVKLKYNAKIADVNDYLASGKNVYIDTVGLEWQPSDIADEMIVIPKNMHLYIDGSFNDSDCGQAGYWNYIVGDATSKLTVTGKLTVSGESGSDKGAMKDFKGTATVGGLEVGRKDVTLNCVTTITGISGTDLYVPSGASLTINKNMTITDSDHDNGVARANIATGASVNIPDGVTVRIAGTWTGSGKSEVASYGTLAANSLSGIFILGDGSTDGKIEGTYTGTNTVVYQNTKHTGEVIDLGASTVLIAMEDIKLGSVPKNATVYSNKKITFAGEVESENIVLGPEATFTLAKGATVSDKAASSEIFKDATGSAIKGTVSQNIKFAAAGSAVAASTTAVTNLNTALKGLAGVTSDTDVSENLVAAILTEIAGEDMDADAVDTVVKSEEGSLTVGADKLSSGDVAQAGSAWPVEFSAPLDTDYSTNAGENYSDKGLDKSDHKQDIEVDNGTHTVYVTDAFEIDEYDAETSLGFFDAAMAKKADGTGVWFGKASAAKTTHAIVLKVTGAGVEYWLVPKDDWKKDYWQYDTFDENGVNYVVLGWDEAHPVTTSEFTFSLAMDGDTFTESEATFGKIVKNSELTLKIDWSGLMATLAEED